MVGARSNRTGRPLDARVVFSFRGLGLARTADGRGAVCPRCSGVIELGTLIGFLGGQWVCRFCFRQATGFYRHADALSDST
jgi:hypothetical protein